MGMVEEDKGKRRRRIRSTSFLDFANPRFLLV